MTEAEAQEYIDAAVALHGATVHGGRDRGTAVDDDPGEQRLQAARDRFDQQAQKAERARFAKSDAGRYVWGAGALLIAIGGLGLHGGAQAAN